MFKYMIKCHCLNNSAINHHIETSQLNCFANQLTGFYMMGTLAAKGLILQALNFK